MCNLYRMTRTIDEVAHLFDAMVQVGANWAEEVYPGYPGLVVAAEQGTRRLRPMTWGFPLARTGAKGQPLKPKPINNARADKLAGGFWRPSFIARRCLIALEAFAEAGGPAGGKTRTWLSLPNQPVLAAAGIWRPSSEWGACYAMVMTEACLDMGGIHDRMPVILGPDEHGAWLGGDPDAALALCRPFSGALQIERTGEPWAGRDQRRLAV